VELKTTCIKIVKFKIIEIRTGYQYYYSKNLTVPHKTFDWAAGWT